MSDKPKVLDLFSGAGGIAEGFRSAGFQIVGGIDSWAPAVETFSANFPEAVGIEADLRKMKAADVTAEIDEKIDIIVGGPSCQGFSTSGGLSRATGRDSSDPRNKLFLNYVDLVENLDPSWIVFENVPGLLLYDQGRVALEIVAAFREIGYSLLPVILLAADYGVPQLRRRLFFIGNRTGSEVSFPEPTHGNEGLWANYALPFAHLSRLGHGKSHDVAQHVSFNDACSDLPILGEGESLDGVPYRTRAANAYQRLMRKGSKAVGQHIAADLPSLDRLAAQTLEPGQNWRDMPIDALPDRFKKIRRYDATTLLKRLRPDAPAYTITTKFNEATTGAFIHPSQPRTLSLREAARLQSFPDRFAFSGSVSQVRHQIGNAVPPLLAQAIAEAIYPQAMQDCFARKVEPIRDRLMIQPSLTDGDILRLRAPRRPAAGVPAELVA
ncbi:MAG TPA: DNA cytosine methyltransferase [Sphingomonas sanguinis]|uniref:DNA cytosine methyltransferase n=1 Tax=Sphingomonas sanguinis TaxID=33051 RepID=UPI002AC0A804|nr:DNA cytosine methyltransferase [Sphingomonas sanguinis]